jgi:hypothetical protein
VHHFLYGLLCACAISGHCAPPGLVSFSSARTLQQGYQTPIWTITTDRTHYATRLPMSE